MRNSPGVCGRVLGNVANEPYRPQVPHEPATRGPRATSTTHHSWPDDEEEQRQQHSDGHAADVDAVLPVAPQVAAADCVGKKDEAKTRRRTERPNDGAISRSLAGPPCPKGSAISDAARAPSASGSNSILGALYPSSSSAAHRAVELFGADRSSGARCATTRRCCVRDVGAWRAETVASRAKHNEDCIVLNKWHYETRLGCAADAVLACLRVRAC